MSRPEGKQCSVTELSFDASGNRAERVLPACDDPGNPGASARLPCYTLVDDASCDTPSGLALAVHYPDGTTVPPLTRAVAACHTE